MYQIIERCDVPPLSGSDYSSVHKRCRTLKPRTEQHVFKVAWQESLQYMTTGKIPARDHVQEAVELALPLPVHGQGQS